MLSKDVKIFEKGSAVRGRMVEYGRLFERLHIIVISRGFFVNETLSEQVMVTHIRVGGILDSAWKALAGIPADSFLDFDVITAQDPFELGAIAHRIAKKLDIALQLQVHTDIFSNCFTNRNFKNVGRNLLARRYLSKADCIRVVSQKIKNSLVQELKIPGEKIIVLPIFVDTQKIKEAKPILPKPFDFTVLWVGRLEKEKNCSLAIDAFAQFARNVPNAGLVIAGEGSEKRSLELKVKSYKLEACVVFAGWRNDVAGYYKNADVLLATSWYEGYGMQMVEARIAGLPVIASDIGVAKEVGAYIAQHSPSSMANLLAQLHALKLPKRQEYQYPYQNKEDYLELYKQSFEQCLPAPLENLKNAPK